MKKYTVYPDDTRGIGNIMNTISSTDEMKGSNCTPTLTTAKINYDNIDFKKWLNKQAELLGRNTNFLYRKTIYKVK